MELVGTLGAWQSPGVCRQVGGHGCGRDKENQKVGGGRGGGFGGGERSEGFVSRVPVMPNCPYFLPAGCLEQLGPTPLSGRSEVFRYS